MEKLYEHQTLQWNLLTPALPCISLWELFKSELNLTSYITVLSVTVHWIAVFLLYNQVAGVCQLSSVLWSRRWVRNRCKSNWNVSYSRQAINYTVCFSTAAAKSLTKPRVSVYLWLPVCMSPVGTNPCLDFYFDFFCFLVFFRLFLSVFRPVVCSQMAFSCWLCVL